MNILNNTTVADGESEQQLMILYEKYICRDMLYCQKEYAFKAS